MLALIDGDIIAYSVGFASDTIYYVSPDGVPFDKKADAVSYTESNGLFTEEIERVVEEEPLENCLHSVKLMIQSIVEDCGADEYKVYLTGSGNFREEVVDNYKANRDSSHKPFWYKEIRDYLVNVHHAEVIEGMEADDAMGIEQYQQYLKDWDLNDGLDLLDQPNRFKKHFTTIIASIDKDMDMIPGWHYNWRKKEKYWIDELQGYKNFCLQCLTGDATDNIAGLYKITGKKATKCIKEKVINASTQQECWQVVQEAYGDENLAEMLVSAELLWIRRS